MRAAQAALADDDGTRALAVVRAHAKRFPDGQLVQEREAARVRALCALDRVDDASAAARRASSPAVMPNPCPETPVRYIGSVAETRKRDARRIRR